MPGADACLPWRSRRVTLRRLHPDDLAAFQAYRTDPGLAEFQGWDVVSDAAALALIEHQAGLCMFRPETWLQLAIEDEQNTLIGDLGICVYASAAEIGYTLNRRFHGHGYATEAVILAVKWTFALTQVWAIQGITDTRNTASVAVLERAGMRHVDTLAGPPTELVYQITRDTITATVSG